jgi:pilus assembly protein CpaE
MNPALQALVALDSDIDRGLIETVVAGGAEVTVLDYVDVGGPTASGFGAGDVLIIACVDYSADVHEYVAAASRQHPGRPVVMLCPPQENGFVADAFGAGVDDIVTLPSNGHAQPDPELLRELRFALEKAIIRKRGEPEAARATTGRLICVLGLKGGSGKTLTVSNLGVALAAKGHSVAIVDLDLQFGDVALALGLRPERTLYDLVRSSGSLDAEKLKDFLVEHPSGAHALLAPVRPDQASLVTVPFLREVQRLLRETHEFVLVDTPPSFTPEVISMVDAATDVVMVAMRDTLSLKNTKLGLETLERMDYDRRNVRIVLNRANTNVGIERQDILAILGRDVDVLIPSHRDVTRAMNQGEAIALQRAAAAGKAFRALAQLYIDHGNGDARVNGGASNGGKQRRSLFRRGR